MAPRQIKMSVKDKQVPRKDSSEEAPSQRKQTEAGSAIFDSGAGHRRLVLLRYNGRSEICVRTVRKGRNVTPSRL